MSAGRDGDVFRPSGLRRSGPAWVLLVVLLCLPLLSVEFGRSRLSKTTATATAGGAK